MARNSVVVIDPKTMQLVADVRVGQTPVPIAYGEGAVWVGNFDDNTVTEIDPRTLKPVSFGVGIAPSGIALADGSVRVVGFDLGIVTHAPRPEWLVRARSGSREVTSRIAVGEGRPRNNYGFSLAITADEGSTCDLGRRETGSRPRRYSL